MVSPRSTSFQSYAPEYITLIHLSQEASSTSYQIIAQACPLPTSITAIPTIDYSHRMSLSIYVFSLSVSVVSR
jgi:hypothetical protein